MAGQKRPGVITQSSPNKFPRRVGSDGTDGGQKRPGTKDQSAPSKGVSGGKVIEGQDLRGYVPASSGKFPSEDGNLRPDGSERTIREVPAP